MFQSFSLKTKLIFTCIFIALLIPIVALFNFISAKKVASQYEQVAQLNVLNTDVLGAFNTLVRDLVVDVVSLNVNAASTEVNNNNELIKKIDETGQKYNQIDQIYVSNKLEGEELGVHINLLDKWNLVYATAKKLTDLAKSTQTDDKLKFNQLLRSEFIPQTKNYYDIYAKLLDIQNLKSDNLVHAAEATAQLGHKISIGVTALGFLIAIIFSWILSQSVTKQLIRVIASLQKESSDLNNSSTSIKKASQTLSSIVNQQSISIEKTVSSMEEMSSMLNQTSQQSTLSAQITDKNFQAAEESQETFTNLFAAIEDIQKSNGQLDQIIKIINEIKSKTHVINDIVFKTSLLSFNASIEAARAGIHGRGFAVVAEEVGKLAILSGTAANEIGSLLDNSTTEVDRVIKDIQVKVSYGKNISNDSCKSFQEISGSLQKINESVKSIENATQQQSIGIQQTNKAMSEMNQFNQVNAKNTQLLSTETVKLNAYSNEVYQTIIQLNQVVFGKDFKVKNNQAS